MSLFPRGMLTFSSLPSIERAPLPSMAPTTGAPRWPGSMVLPPLTSSTADRGENAVTTAASLPRSKRHVLDKTNGHRIAPPCCGVLVTRCRQLNACAGSSKASSGRHHRSLSPWRQARTSRASVCAQTCFNPPFVIRLSPAGTPSVHSYRRNPEIPRATVQDRS